MAHLPSLPIDGSKADGSIAFLRYDHFGRVTVRVKDEDGTLIDIMGPYWTASEALAGLALEYPNTTYKGDR